MICHLLHTKDIFKAISLLSSFHYKFINDIQQSRLIYKCIEHDFGKTFLHKLNVKLQFNNDEENEPNDDDHMHDGDNENTMTNKIRNDNKSFHFVFMLKFDSTLNQSKSHSIKHITTNKIKSTNHQNTKHKIPN